MLDAGEKVNLPDDWPKDCEEFNEQTSGDSDVMDDDVIDDYEDDE